MRQRVAFMRTLLAGRPVLLLDEPFASLDAITRADMHDWLADALAAEPRTVVLVTHDVEEAVRLSDRVAVLSPRPGRVVAELDVPVPRAPAFAVSDPLLLGVRERALEALAVRRVLLATALLAAFMGLWAWVASLGLGRRPDAGLARRDRRTRSPTTASLLLDNAWVTLYEVLLGLAIAVVGRRRAPRSRCT